MRTPTSERSPRCKARPSIGRVGGAFPTMTARPPLRVAASAAPIVSSEPTHSKTTSAPSGRIRSLTASAIGCAADRTSRGRAPRRVRGAPADGSPTRTRSTPLRACGERREEPDRPCADDDCRLARLERPTGRPRGRRLRVARSGRAGIRGTPTGTGMAFAAGHDDVLRKAAGDLAADEAHVGAELRLARHRSGSRRRSRQAGRRRSASPGQAVRVAAELLDSAVYLVADQERRPEERMRPRPHLQVGAADADVVHAHPDLARSPAPAPARGRSRTASAPRASRTDRPPSRSSPVRAARRRTRRPGDHNRSILALQRDFLQGLRFRTSTTPALVPPAAELRERRKRLCESIRAAAPEAHAPSATAVVGAGRERSRRVPRSILVRGAPPSARPSGNPTTSTTSRGSRCRTPTRDRHARRTHRRLSAASQRGARAEQRSRASAPRMRTAVLALTGGDEVRPLEELRPRSAAGSSAGWRPSSSHRSHRRRGRGARGTASSRPGRSRWSTRSRRRHRARPRSSTPSGPSLPTLEIRDASPFLDELRCVKSDWEIGVMREAGRLTGLAVLEAMRSTASGSDGVRARRARRVRLPPGRRVRRCLRADRGDRVRTSGTATTGRRPPSCESGQLVLMDAAPDYRYYTSDIGRMWPVSRRLGAMAARALRVHRPLPRRAASPPPSRTSPRRRFSRVRRRRCAPCWRRPRSRSRLTSRPLAKRSTSPTTSRTRSACPSTTSASTGAGSFVPGLVFSVDPMLWVPDEQLYIRCEDTVAVTEDGDREPDRGSCRSSPDRDRSRDARAGPARRRSPDEQSSDRLVRGARGPLARGAPRRQRASRRDRLRSRLQGDGHRQRGERLDALAGRSQQPGRAERAAGGAAAADGGQGRRGAHARGAHDVRDAAPAGELPGARRHDAPVRRSPRGARLRLPALARSRRRDRGGRVRARRNTLPARGRSRALPTTSSCSDSRPRTPVRSSSGRTTTAATTHSSGSRDTTTWSAGSSERAGRRSRHAHAWSRRAAPSSGSATTSRCAGRTRSRSSSPRRPTSATTTTSRRASTRSPPPPREPSRSSARGTSRATARRCERVRLRLGDEPDEDLEALPTDVRLERVKAGRLDPGLVELHFQFGRYLLLGSSRPGDACRRTCRGSGTTATSPRGTASSRSTSTCR